MDLLPAAAAVAVILITAGFILRTTPLPGDKHAGSTPQSPSPPGGTTVTDAEPRDDPWVVEAEPLVLDEMSAGLRGGPAPVLAYVDQPRRSPDPERLIQTEVLVESGTMAQAWRALRLFISLVALGALLGFGLIAAVRAGIWLFT